jgi:NAD(P)-dependent dehydrogenase (short-subunit alcohol dehydrogenase family)
LRNSEEISHAKNMVHHGATRGFGVEIAKAALRAGDRVVATGRKLASVAASVGRDSDQLLCLELDVCDPEKPRAAVRAAVEKFGGIDVLVNNAGYGHLAFFEENTPADVEAQFERNVFGVFNVTRAAPPHKEGRGTVSLVRFTLWFVAKRYFHE